MNGIKVEGDRQHIGEALDALSGLLPHRPNIAKIAAVREQGDGDYIGTRKAAALMDLLYALQNATRPKMEALSETLAGVSAMSDNVD